MTQEDKSLLLKDLCSRLPYGVKVQHQRQDYLDEVQTIEQITRKYGEIETESVLGFVDDFKPYLRPMSSMTKEEKEEYNSHLSGIVIGIDAANFMIWVYKHHLDIFHFVEKGLALEAPEGMYN